MTWSKIMSLIKYDAREKSGKISEKCTHGLEMYGHVQSKDSLDIKFCIIEHNNQ